MTIEIQEPKLEELIQDHMRSGRFQSVEQILLEAMEKYVGPREAAGASSKPNLADFLLHSPLRGSGLVVDRMQDDPREIDL